jgi:hypothetical protein
MRRPTRRALLAVTVAAVVVVGAGAGCPRPPAPVVLDGAWPSAAAVGDFDDVTRAWTRSAQLRGDYQLVAELHATIRSPAWRAAWIERQARHGKLSAAARAQLETEQRAADEAALEISLVLTTWDRDENDLERGAKASWRVWLVDASGAEIPATEIVRDKRPEYVLRSELPGFGDFAEAYVARFPREPRLLGPGVDRLTLRMAGARGGLELVWAGQRE